jgi:DNA-binding transcriptional regulator YiaG
MKNEIIENYTFTGFGFPVVLPLAVFKTNSRGVRFLDLDTEELKNKVAINLITHPYTYNGAMLNFMRHYIEFSTIQLAEVLEVAQQTISNWEQKKKNIALDLTEKQKSRLVLKMQQYYLNKLEQKVSENFILSKDSPKSNAEQIVIIDELYKAS